MVHTLPLNLSFQLCPLSITWPTCCYTGTGVSLPRAGKGSPTDYEAKYVCGSALCDGFYFLSETSQEDYPGSL